MTENERLQLINSNEKFKLLIEEKNRLKSFMENFSEGETFTISFEGKPGVIYEYDIPNDGDYFYKDEFAIILKQRMRQLNKELLPF